MYTGTGSGYGNNYPGAGWGDGAYSTSFTGYSSEIYPPDPNQRIPSQASQPQTNQTPPSYRPTQPPRTYQHNTTQNTSSYFSPNSSAYKQNTDYSYPTQAGQQPPLSGYSTTIANSNEGKYRDTSRVDGHYPDYEQVETELDRYTRYQSATDEDYYSQSLGLNRSNLQGSFNTSLNIKRSPKSILKKQKQKGKTKYNQPRPVDTDTKMLNQLHSRQNSYNQSRKSNIISGQQHQSGIPVQPGRKELYSQYPTKQYGETGASFPPNVRVGYKFGQKRPKKKKRKINPPLLSTPNFPPPSQRDVEPVSNRVEENDTESVHMRHELDVKDQQLKVASDLLTKQGEMLKRLESSMNNQMHVGIVPQRAPAVPDMYSQLSPGEGRNSSQVTDDYWYQSEMPPVKRGRFSGTNTNTTHPPIENSMDTSPYYSKNARRKLTNRKMNPRGTGGLLITTQQGLKSPKQLNNSHGEMNTGLHSRPEDSERTVQLTERGNTRNPRSLPSPLLGSTPESIASKYGRHCHQCGLEFFFDFSKHALHPMHMKRKTRILSGCKPCNVMKFKNYEEYLSHQALLTHIKIKKIVLAHRDSKYPFQGVKVTYPQYDSSKFHGEDVVKEITSYYCEACEKLISSTKKSAHLHSKSHYQNWVLHLRIEKYKSLVARESELKKKTLSSEKKATSATTSKDETNNGSTKNTNGKGKKKKNKAGKKNITISKKSQTKGTNQNVEQKPDSQSATEKPMDTSQTSEATIDKPKDNSPSIEIINEAESEDILEIKADEPEVAVAHEFIDLTDTVKAEDIPVTQEKSTVESNAAESVDKEKDAKDENSDHIEKDNCLNEGQMDDGTAEIDIPQAKEIQETHQVESEIPESNQSSVEEANPVAVRVDEAETNKETTTEVSDDNVTVNVKEANSVAVPIIAAETDKETTTEVSDGNVTVNIKEANSVAVPIIGTETDKETTVVSEDNAKVKAALEEMTKKASPTKRRTRQSPRVRN